MTVGEPNDGLSRLVDLIESRLAPALERIAAALERGADPGEVRGESFLGGAEATGSTRAAPFGRELSVESLRGHLRAAREVGDPDRILEIRDELAARLPEADRADLDREVVGGLMGLIQRRLRIKPITPDLPLLAASVAERFGATAEGASLRRALPTLRRSVGLCPRCARPYRGIADACPECLLEAAAREPQVLPMTRAEGDEPEEAEVIAGAAEFAGGSDEGDAEGSPSAPN